MKRKKEKQGKSKRKKRIEMTETELELRAGAKYFGSFMSFGPVHFSQSLMSVWAWHVYVLARGRVCVR